jgi:hypothetical protein
MAPSCNRIHLALDFQDLGDFALCLLDIAAEAEGRREFQMNVPEARRKRPRSSKRFHGFIDAAQEELAAAQIGITVEQVPMTHLQAYCSQT